MNTSTNYKPGDEANGHVLNADLVWVPLLPSAASGQRSGPSRKSVWLKLIFGGVTAIVLLAVASGLSGTPTAKPADSAAAPAPAAADSAAPPAPAAVAPAAEPAPPAEPAPTPAPAVGPTPTRPAATLAQKNALRSAESYLQFSGFSRQGLIDQLSSEHADDYSVADATWAVNQLDVDYREQALRSAESYLKFSGFSRQGLIDQLTSQYADKYTSDEANYAADRIGL